MIRSSAWCYMFAVWIKGTSLGIPFVEGHADPTGIISTGKYREGQGYQCRMEYVPKVVQHGRTRKRLVGRSGEDYTNLYKD